MLTQIVTFLIFVAVIGCILYGRRLIKTEKVDAVFGNPERALGGTHWVIVGSIFSEKSPDEIIKIDAFEKLRNLDLERNLTMQRSNGLSSMVKRIKEEAQKYI